MTRTVLISGASIAGPALAYWLSRSGQHVTVVERATELRDGGQNVDVRGAGRETIRRMGLEQAVRDATTGEAGLRFVDAAGRTLASFPAGTTDSGGATAELEILRGDLARLLVSHCSNDVTYQFGDHITALHEHDDQVDVTFAHGASRSFDLVVAADGIRSSTRGLMMATEAQIKPLNLYMAWLTIPRGPSDTQWARWFNAPGGRSLLLRPDNVGTTRAALSFTSEPRGYEDLRGGELTALLRERFSGAGWEVERVLDAAEDTDIYFEAISQVHAPRWTTGRMALVGDAAYCASPVSGMGTSLALTGAYVLAGELSRHDDHRKAYATYESLMRPYVDQAQKLPPGTPRVAHPRTRAGVTALNTAARLAASPVVKQIAGKVFNPPADDIHLPSYEMR